MHPIAPPPYQYPEDVYYGDGTVWVTNRRLICGENFNLLKNVRSAHTKVLSGKVQSVGHITLRLTVVLLFGASIFSWGFPYSANSLSAEPTLIFRLVGAAIILFALAASIVTLVNRAKMPGEPIYILVVKYRLGYSNQTWASLDRDYIERIVETIQYAVRRRTDTAYTEPPPAFTDIAFSVPKPVVQGNTLYVGQASYSLTETRSVTIALVDRILPPQIPLLSILALQPLSVVMNFLFGLTVGIIVIGVAFFFVGINQLLSLFMGASNGQQILYAVQLTSNSGVKAAVFASTSRAEAEQVRKNIADELAPQAALSTT